MSQTAFLSRLDAVAAATETALDVALSELPRPGEIMRPQRLLAAMRYAALGGGKRFRPFLVVESAALFGVPQARALPAAIAIECLHCYSLVHDDLPALDDDDLRRGRASAHRQFDEATAILAGDALLTLAFDILAREETHPDPSVRVALAAGLARAAGIGGMAGGQMLDLEAEGRFGQGGLPSIDGIERLQSMKTGALIAFACDAGAILGGADDKSRAALARYARALGLAFQVADDLLDATAAAETIGKATGKDKGRGKATIVSTLGIEGARKRLAELTGEAERALAIFRERAGMLAAAAKFAAERPR
jgi:farnesyl diphosphate synthase